MKRTHALLAFVGLTVLLTAGAAQSLSGSNTVFSDDIVDGQVKFADIKPDAVTSSRIATNAVGATEIRDGQVGSPEVNEESLVFPTAQSEDGNAICNADGATEDCTTTSITLATPGKVYIMGTFGWETDPSVATASYGIVKLVVNGTTVETVRVGEAGQDENLYPGPIQELVSLPAGTHTIKITFQEETAADDVDLNETHIVAWKVSA